MDLVAELTKLREQKGISQAAVAAELGCDQSAVSLWEKGKTSPSGSARILLASFIERMRRLPDVAGKATAA